MFNRVIATIDAKMVKPTADRPYEGMISIHSEISPMASSEYEQGRFVIGSQRDVGQKLNCIQYLWGRSDDYENVRQGSQKKWCIRQGIFVCCCRTEGWFTILLLSILLTRLGVVSPPYYPVLNRCREHAGLCLLSWYCRSATLSKTWSRSRGWWSHRST